MNKLKGRKPAPVIKETSSKPDTVDEEPSVILHKLTSEEANLLEEKNNLVSLREKLRVKTQEEIEIKEERVRKLRAEIIDLKVSCEELTKSLKELTQKHKT